MGEKGEEIPFGKDDCFVIFCHTYCLNRKEKMTVATRKSMEAAAGICKRFSNATIFFPCCSYPADLTEKERVIKSRVLVNSGVVKEKFKYLGTVTNTITEVKKGIDFLSRDRGFKGVVVVTEQNCAKSQLILWKKLLPSGLKLGYCAIEGECNDDCIYLPQKSPKLWLLASIFRYYLFLVFGTKAGFIKEPAIK